MDSPPPANLSARPKYRWPWFVLAAVVLAIILYVAWVWREVEKTRRIRDLNGVQTRQANPSRGL